MDAIRPAEDLDFEPPSSTAPDLTTAPVTPTRRKRHRRRNNNSLRNNATSSEGDLQDGSGPEETRPPPYHQSNARTRRNFGFPYLCRVKNCCDGSPAGGIRWFIAVIFIIGVGCSVSGAVMGAGYSSSTSNSREGFTLSLLMIGVGIVLLTVSAIAWKMTTPPDPHEDDIDFTFLNCCAMMTRRGPLNASSRYGGFDTLPLPNNSSTLLSHAVPPREPPPSYAASMQEYRLRLLLYERSNPSGTFLPWYNTAPPPPPYYLMNQPAQSTQGAGQQSQQRRIIIHPHPYPPPTVPYALPAFGYPPPPIPPPALLPPLHHPGIHLTSFPSLSRPPSYRSRSSNTNLENEEQGATTSSPTITPPLPIQHTRSSSLLSNPLDPNSNNTTTTVVTVLHTHTSGGSSPTDTDATKKDNNLITIVQTSDSSQVNCQQGSSVIVTVNSGNGATMVCTGCGCYEQSCYCTPPSEPQQPAINNGVGTIVGVVGEETILARV